MKVEITCCPICKSNKLIIDDYDSTYCNVPDLTKHHLRIHKDEFCEAIYCSLWGNLYEGNFPFIEVFKDGSVFLSISEDDIDVQFLEKIDILNDEKIEHYLNYLDAIEILS